jgi:hypothetical protein
MSDEPTAELSSDRATDRNRITFHHKVNIMQMRAPKQRITHDSPHHTHLTDEVRGDDGDDRVCQQLTNISATIRHMSWDPLSEKLVENSPLRTPELVAAFARYEHLTISELDTAWDAINVAFREWVDAPDNAGAPIQSSPQYWDRIAIDSLRERRTWWE